MRRRIFAPPQRGEDVPQSVLAAGSARIERHRLLRVRQGRARIPPLVVRPGEDVFVSAGLWLERNGLASDREIGGAPCLARSVQAEQACSR